MTNQPIQAYSKQYSPLLMIPEIVLEEYLNSHSNTPIPILGQLLYMAHKYQLDPILGEIQLQEYDTGWQVFITIDGWMKIINDHPHFQGLSLRESTHVEPNNYWMECSIYRDDRILPITIKEYLSELKTDHDLWQQMPRRMLRHRVIQQCARVAFGIALPEIKDPLNSAEIISTDLDNQTKKSGITRSNLKKLQNLGVTALKEKMHTSGSKRT